MRFQLTFITGFSLLFMALGLYLSFSGIDGPVGARYFFTSLGIAGWFVGNRLVELDARIAELEGRLAGGETPAEAAAAPAVAGSDPA